MEKSLLQEIISPFARPSKGLRIKEGSPPLLRPTKEAIELFPSEANELIKANYKSQKELKAKREYSLESLKGKHFLIAGATGQGLGCSLACAVMELVKDSGSLTMISRDLKKSIGFETGKVLESLTVDMGISDRFAWSNDGLALEGKSFETILDTLKNLGANDIVYINTVASASSGIISGYPPVFVKDVDDDGLFEWKLTELSDKAIETTKLFMGTMARDFPDVLLNGGIRTDISVFADWRGSLDKASREPSSPFYGRQGAYSTSLYLPKDILQEAVSKCYTLKTRKAIDIFFPIMQTRALAFIPGGNTMAGIFNKLFIKQGLSPKKVPELSLLALEAINRNISGADNNPFPRLDLEELRSELWFYELVRCINNDESSDFYYKNWL